MKERINERKKEIRKERRKKRKKNKKCQTPNFPAIWERHRAVNCDVLEKQTV